MLSTYVGRAFGMAALLGLAGAAPAFAANLAVPQQYAAIQFAIDASATGDTITVAPGTYHENLDFEGKGIRLVSQSGAALTTIVGAASGYVLSFQHSETRSTAVSGFTIQQAPGTYEYAMYALNASPTVTDSVFPGGNGTAVEGFSSSMLLERNLFTGWTCAAGATVAVVQFVNTSSPSVKDNVFSQNHCAGMDVTLPTGNAPDVANNTFVGNDVGLQIDARVDGHLQRYRNNLVFGNGTGVLVNLGVAGNYATLQNNLVYGNTTNYDGFPDQTGVNGNISADPKLGGLAVPDFHPDAGSAAIGAGIVAAVDAGDADYYRAVRLRTTAAPQVDIGAVQYVGLQPSVSLKISASSVTLGTPVSLTWSASNASSCMAAGSWSGILALSGTQTVTPGAGALTYQVVCSNAAATRLQAATLTVIPPPAIVIKATPAVVTAGGNSTLSWSVTNATACQKSGAWTGAAATSGSQLVSPAAGTYQYQLACTGPAGSATASAQLTVNPMPTVSLGFSATDIPLGATTTMSWQTSGVTTCSASGSWTGTVATSGTRVIGPLAAGFYPYVLTCSGPGGTTSNQMGFSVFAPAPPYSSSSLVFPGESVYGIANLGQPVPKGGLDGKGNAYASNLLGPQLNWAGQTFYLGYSGQPSAVSNTTVALVPAQLVSLSLLATGVNGNQLNQKFVVTYTDGTQTVFTQSLSDWRHPQNFAGESIALATAYRVTANGSQQLGPYNIYAYRIVLDPSRTVQSLALPSNGNVVVMGINYNTAPTVYNNPLDAAYNVYGSATTGQPAPSGGLDTSGYAYAAAFLPQPISWSGQFFLIPSAGYLNGVANATIPLSGGKTLQLTVLATGVHGAQLNQVFVVTYTDGSTTLFKQSLSDWHIPQGFAGESVAVSTNYRITASGTQQAGLYDLYAYTFTTDGSKSIRSLTLPPNRDVVVLAVNSTNVN